MKEYKSLIGKNVLIPLVNRTIKIIADYYADPEQGSGAVKITPAHDFNDYEVGKRNDLKIINVLEKNGSVNKNGIKEFIGLDRFEARKLLIKKLKENNFLGNGINLDTNFEVSSDSFKGKFAVTNPNFNNSDKSLYFSAEAIEYDNYKTYGIKQPKLVLVLVQILNILMI